MAKRSPLVCEHLENILRDALETHADILQRYVRGRHGVYALYRAGKLYYVGLASNLRTRLRDHLRDRHGESWDRFSVYLTINDSHMKELESLLLRIVRPGGNRQRGHFARSTDLRRRFAGDIRTRQKADLEQLLGTRRTPVVRTRVLTRAADRSAPLARFELGAIEIRARLKGKLIRARLRRDGTIRFQGKVYASPSSAGGAATRRSCNGWTFWTYERSPGDWVKLDRLRK